MYYNFRSVDLGWICKKVRVHNEWLLLLACAAALQVTTVCSIAMSQFLLQMNLGALLTASLAHTSFEKAAGRSYSYDCFKVMLDLSQQ